MRTPLPAIDTALVPNNRSYAGTTSCGCESITEDTKHVIRGKKLSQLIQKDESRLRLNMWELVRMMSKDESNKKLADVLSKNLS